MPQLAIVEAFSDLPDPRRTAGQRHQQALCLSLFTLAVTAGNRGFLAIGDWLRAYHDELVALFDPLKGRLPSYSTIPPLHSNGTKNNAKLRSTDMTEFQERSNCGTTQLLRRF